MYTWSPSGVTSILVCSTASSLSQSALGALANVQAGTGLGKGGGEGPDLLAAPHRRRQNTQHPTPTAKRFPAAGAPPVFLLVHALTLFRRWNDERQASCYHGWRCAATREPEAELSLSVVPPTVQRANAGDAARVRAPHAEIGEGVATGNASWDSPSGMVRRIVTRSKTAM